MHLPPDEFDGEDKRAAIVGLLKDIIGPLDPEANTYEVSNVERAAWRLADAGAQLRSMLETNGAKDLIGLDKLTFAGAMLPTHEKVSPQTVMEVMRHQVDVLGDLDNAVRNLQAALVCAPSYSTLAKAYADHIAIPGGEESARRILKSLRVLSVVELSPKDYAYFLKALAE